MNNINTISRFSKVSVIVPVFNVKPYLRRCLDSVLNQTLKEIQVICINDGSTDGSRDILEEYAARDERIMILDQENSGGGAARNTAFPYIKGKYTFFTDADDWLDLTLCEKTWQKAEQTDADIIYFSMAKTKYDTHSPKFQKDMPEIRILPEERSDLLLYFNSTWLKLWRSDFLLENEITFSKGRRPYNDVAQNWKGIVLADKIATLDEELYHRSIRKGSYQQTLDKSHFSIIDIINDIQNMLVETGKYEMYKNVFIPHKLLSFRRTYLKLPMKYRRELRKLICQSLTEQDREFVASPFPKAIPLKVQHFYDLIDKYEHMSCVKLYMLEMKSLLGKIVRNKVSTPIKTWIKKTNCF